MAAHDDNPLAKRQLLTSRNRTAHVIERHNIDRSVRFHGQHRYDRSRSDNHSIRVKRNNVIRHGLDTAANSCLYERRGVCAALTHPKSNQDLHL